MSEHVLCMVLYLIELGLDNQVQDNKEDEVSTSTICTASKHYPSIVLFLIPVITVLSTNSSCLVFLYLPVTGALH